MPEPRDIQTMVVGELNANKGELARLARLSGISYRYIGAIANGQIKNPSFRNLVKIAAYLGVRVIWEPCAHFNRFDEPKFEEYVPLGLRHPPEGG
jgi:transcriptional regulator with XRE-family HTH domain